MLQEVEKNKTYTFEVLENCVYPIEFLHSMRTTGFKTLADYFEQLHAPKEALDLLADLQIMAVWMETQQGDMTSAVANIVMQDTVASAARNIVKLGGVFHDHAGTTTPRDV